MKGTKNRKRAGYRADLGGGLRAELTKLPLTAADLLVVPVFGERLDGQALKELDRATGGLLLAEASRQGFAGKPESSFLFQTHGSLPPGHILLVGCGTRDQSATWYQLADAAVRAARQVRARSILVEPTTEAPHWAARVLCEGVSLAAYRFTRYRMTQQDDEPLECLALRPDTLSAAARRELEWGAVAARATRYARDLVNTPAAELTPAALAEAAKELAGPGLRVTVYNEKALEKLGMGCVLAVARGSAHPARFVEMVYRPRTGKPRAVIALVGKAVTFDSGGLSAKNPEAMRIQKRDMAGGAVVLGVMKALCELRLPVQVRGYVPAAENMPGGRATKPGDVARAFNGKTVEILNTDAEGRLLLADALSYAASRHPDAIIDFATLTAAVHNALGSRYAAIMGTDRSLVAACISAGAEVDERLWELPLVAEYRRDIDSTVADLKNTGEGQAGTIIGGLFLREFVGDVPWAHVDFASTAFTTGFTCHPAGATGFGVRTALRYLLRC